MQGKEKLPYHEIQASAWKRDKEHATLLSRSNPVIEKWVALMVYWKNNSAMYAKRNMIKYPKTADRPEQIRARNIIRDNLKKGYTIEIHTEYYVKDIKVVDQIDLTGQRTPRLDIAIFIIAPFQAKIGIQLNGPPHGTKKRSGLDDLQKQVLEHKDNGWKIVAFEHWKMPKLWQTEGIPPSYTKTDYDEVQESLKGILPLKKH